MLEVRFLVYILFCFQVFVYNTYCEGKKDAKDDVLPPCQACKVLIQSFHNGMEKTNKNHYGGGDTAWEEKNLGDYAGSETRLIEIQEHLCSDVTKGTNQCYSLAESWENHLETWWFKHRKEEPDLHKWLCIDKVEHCCPEFHYGPECKPCPGFPDNVCNNSGKCKGSGTRKGNGDCICNEGYMGKFCTECAPNYYVAYKDDNKILCSKCHQACQSSCNTSGPKGCSDCREGWIMSEGKGCLDLNECLTGSPCKSNEFCINNEGSYTCLACDPACADCDGDGPDMCGQCADGYSKRDGICVRERGWRERNADWHRYITYLGLCIATFIIFQKNTTIASIIGLLVALYVSLSEYFLQNVLNTDQESLIS